MNNHFFPSLGWQTDLFFAQFDGEVVNSTEYLVARSPANPTFWWGNFILFHEAPRLGCLAHWLDVFKKEIEDRQPDSRHRAFGIDSCARLVLPNDFAAAGFKLQEATVLTLRAARRRSAAIPLPNGFEFSPLQLPEEGNLVVDKQVAVDSGSYEAISYREFASYRMDRYAAMHAAGFGHWFGLFAQVGRQRVLAASCGLFRGPGHADHIGRFQTVTTHPDWRRQGLCTALVDAVCRYGFEKMGLSTLVMVADPDDIAIHIYQSLGFERGVSTWQLELAPTLATAI